MKNIVFAGLIAAFSPSLVLASSQGAPLCLEGLDDTAHKLIKGTASPEEVRSLLVPALDNGDALLKCGYIHSDLETHLDLLAQSAWEDLSFLTLVVKQNLRNDKDAFVFSAEDIWPQIKGYYLTPTLQGRILTGSASLYEARWQVRQEGFSEAQSLSAQGYASGDDAKAAWEDKAFMTLVAQHLIRAKSKKPEEKMEQPAYKKK